MWWCIEKGIKKKRRRERGTQTKRSGRSRMDSLKFSRRKINARGLAAAAGHIHKPTHLQLSLLLVPSSHLHCRRRWGPMTNSPSARLTTDSFLDTIFFVTGERTRSRLPSHRDRQFSRTNVNGVTKIPKNRNLIKLTLRRR